MQQTSEYLAKTQEQKEEKIKDIEEYIHRTKLEDFHNVKVDLFKAATFTADQVSTRVYLLRNSLII